MFTINNNKKYHEALPILLDSYNKSYHRSIKNNEDTTFYNLYGFKKNKEVPMNYLIKIFTERLCKSRYY